MKRVLVLVAVFALVQSGGAATPQTVVPPVDDPGGFWNILPPGQEGNTNALEALSFFGQGSKPAHWDDQRAMYADLIRDYPELTEERIDDYFKLATFAPEGMPTIERPKPGVTIVRDRFGVPHIYGRTDADVVWGAGYVTGSDRMFFTDVLRHVGRGRVSEFLGASEANLELDRATIKVAGYTDRELQFQIDQMPRKFGHLGELARESFRAFTEGMNAWMLEALADPQKLPVEYAALQVPLKPWKMTDVAAVATLIQAVFAVGGGGEIANAALLQELRAKDPQNADALFRDLLVREDPEAPVSTEASFPYHARPATVDAASVALPDPGSVQFNDPISTLRDGLRRLGLMLPERASNWLAVDRWRAEGGKPIALMGPQVGYWSPEILMEVSLHGPTINSRGATFPGISLAVLLGRGVDYAWSATSGGSDIVDARVEKLCDPLGGTPALESRHYVLNGQCVPMYTRTDRWFAKPSAGSIESDGLPAEPTVVTVDIERTVHGPVAGRATVGGEPVAIVFERSTWFGEVDSTPAFVLLNTNRVHDPDTFFEAMNRSTGTFNWLYVDEKDVAFFHAGLYPVRHPSVDPELPTWGTGEWEWRGFLPLEKHPHVVLAEGGPGYIANWNNKPSRDWHASDANYAYSTIHRVQSLSERLAQGVSQSDLSVVDMIKVMADAATVDLRGSQVLPWALQVLEGRPAVAGQVATLQGWVDGGAHRIDRDRSGRYDEEAAVALMDAWYERMIHAVFDDELDGLYGLIPQGFDDHNRQGHLGSSFQGGYYHYLEKAFRQALGNPVPEPLDRMACGDGTQAACADVLEGSLIEALEALQARYGEDPATWQAPKVDEDIRFSAVGVVTVEPIDWQNRPTFQQVVQVERARAS